MWTKSLVDWIENDTANISVVFSWNLQDAYQKAIWYKSMGYKVRVGGPAIHGKSKSIFDGIAQTGGHIFDVVRRHNPNATFTTRGCIRKCPFCLVPIIESEFIELDDFPLRPIVCDNNILASSDYHFDMVCEKLSDLKNIDFNQGLDTRLLTPYHAKKIKRLNMKFVRIAFDSRKYEKHFLKAFHILTDAGIPTRKIRVLALINFRESPEDAIYRLEKIRELGAMPNPMRYQPLYAQTKDSYLAPGWNERRLKSMQRYYFRLAWLGGITFEQYIQRMEDVKRS